MTMVYYSEFPSIQKVSLSVFSLTKILIFSSVVCQVHDHVEKNDKPYLNQLDSKFCYKQISHDEISIQLLLFPPQNNFPSVQFNHYLFLSSPHWNQNTLKTKLADNAKSRHRAHYRTLPRHNIHMKNTTRKYINSHSAKQN